MEGGTGGVITCLGGCRRVSIRQQQQQCRLLVRDRWLQANPGLKGDALAKAVDQQPWDPSIKALTAFPSVLGNMDKNLSWTSTLGDAYYKQQGDVMNAEQVMRQRACQRGSETAGRLDDV